MEHVRLALQQVFAKNRGCDGKTGTDGLRGHSGGNGPSSCKGASARAGPQYNPDGTKKVFKDVEAFGEGLKKSPGTVDSQQVPLNCAVAGDNIHYQADLMLEVWQKNVRDGSMTQAAFDSAAPRIRKNKGKCSVSDCPGGLRQRRRVQPRTHRHQAAPMRQASQVVQHLALARRSA